VYRPVGHDCEHKHNTRPPRNHIATIIVGDHVRKGPNAMRVTHYNLLRTIEDMYGLPLIGGSATVPPITDIWQGSPPFTVVKKKDRHECLSSTEIRRFFYWAASTMMPMFFAPLERAR